MLNTPGQETISRSAAKEFREGKSPFQTQCTDKVLDGLTGDVGAQVLITRGLEVSLAHGRE